jgi:hypothetical protein
MRALTCEGFLRGHEIIDHDTEKLLMFDTAALVQDSKQDSKAERRRRWMRRDHSSQFADTLLRLTNCEWMR